MFISCLRGYLPPSCSTSFFTRHWGFKISGSVMVSRAEQAERCSSPPCAEASLLHP